MAIHRKLFPLQPNRRNVLIVIPVKLIVVYAWIIGVRKLIGSITFLANVKVKSRRTIPTAAAACMYLFIAVPGYALFRMYKARFAQKNTRWWCLFSVQSPVRPKFDQAVHEISDHMNRALQRAEGQRVLWAFNEHLDPYHKQVIKELVENHLGVSESNDLIEMSPLVLLMLNFIMATGLVWAAYYASLEIISSNITDDNQIGRVLLEWITNYFLLLVSLIQIISRGSWINAIQGICTGPLATMMPTEREALIALYVALADGKIEGLRQDGSYARFPQDGISWKAPPVSSAVLALIGERFIVKRERDDDQWSVRWESECDEEEFQVRLIHRADVPSRLLDEDTGDLKSDDMGYEEPWAS